MLRTAHGFFDSVPDLASELLSMVEVERALAVEEVALEHSLAMCPVCRRTGRGSAQNGAVTLLV